MKIKCLIVDDEVLSQDVIEAYIKEYPVLELVRKCSNAIAALEALREAEIQLIFLDIKMPNLSGLNMLKMIPAPPCVIFTTAYAEHAVEGFELNAVDYLLKPFSFERFVQAVNKARHKMELEQVAASGKHIAAEFIVVKSDKKLHKVNFEDITYFTSIGDYQKIFLKNGRVIVTNETMKHMEEALPSARFLRIHKSYLVAVQAIQYMEGNQLVVDGVALPIGLKYKEQVIERFGGRG
ncbi:two component transcriptional regulator, LytTR family [Chitinophaga jiangningensis]|uniref:Two component transcriptional regulator, LytTR family n=1 Tax=Chitinophaga jiangningensis TaxID=1419482 RepID=A0A1M6XTU1_9BACT|nr:LytTR family DNA-binding domain-containing protein [Chitinophaga jiangningensis]SHL09402.1 two component transcriptional regulator, LytTR family [Chitinophaga jiangningensis]